MASSSHKTHNDYHYSCPLDDGGEDRDWLELGLGVNRTTTTATTCRKQEHNVEQSNYHFSGSAAASSSLVHCQAHQQIGHSLGLELGLGIVGFDDNGASGGVRRDKDVAPLSNYYHKSSLRTDNQGQENHDYNLDLIARSSSPSSPWHIISSSTTSFLDWKRPVSNDFHNCSSLPPPPPTLPSSLPTETTRPHLPGLWFTLHSSVNREGEALPQIPKAYIRVKDENMTVFMVKKYLVRKLGLSNEAEIEISCMSQKLKHTQTLKQVRDTVWLPGLVDSGFINRLINIY